MNKEEITSRLKDYDLLNNIIYVICRSGNTSIKATQHLNELGFNAVNVTGGVKGYF